MTLVAASGTSAAAGADTSAESGMIRPSPIHCASRPATTAPSRPPIADADTIAP